MIKILVKSCRPVILKSPVSFVASVVVPVLVKIIWTLLRPVTVAEYQIPASRPPTVTELLVADSVLEGTPLQVVLVNVTVYKSTGKLLVGWEKYRVADVAVTDEMLIIVNRTSSTITF